MAEVKNALGGAPRSIVVHATHAHLVAVFGIEGWSHRAFMLEAAGLAIDCQREPDLGPRTDVQESLFVRASLVVTVVML